MGRGTGSSGRCRPQTLQRFLSLGFNSMLSACHSDLRSVPVIRTAFKAGPKQQSCLRGGKVQRRVMERGRGAHKPARCTFKLTWGRYIFTFLLTLPRLMGDCVLVCVLVCVSSWIFLILLVSAPSDHFTEDRLREERLFWLTTLPFSPGGVGGGRLIECPLRALDNTWQVCTPFTSCVCEAFIAQRKTCREKYLSFSNLHFRILKGLINSKAEDRMKVWDRVSWQP